MNIKLLNTSLTHKQKMDLSDLINWLRKKNTSLTVVHQEYIEQVEIEWARLSVDRFQRAQNLEPQTTPGINATLRPYQEEGFRWLSHLAAWGAGACLADDMCLEKQSRSFLASLSLKQRTFSRCRSSFCRWKLEQGSRSVHPDTQVYLSF